ncbi:hypothetical protein HK098_006577, partial [Nowakowskiella sp. JEL0407]
GNFDAEIFAKAIDECFREPVNNSHVRDGMFALMKGTAQDLLNRSIFAGNPDNKVPSNRVEFPDTEDESEKELTDEISAELSVKIIQASAEDWERDAVESVHQARRTNSDDHLAFWRILAIDGNLPGSLKPSETLTAHLLKNADWSPPESRSWKAWKGDFDLLSKIVEKEARYIGTTGVVPLLVAAQQSENDMREFDSSISDFDNVANVANVQVDASCNLEAQAQNDHVKLTELPQKFLRSQVVADVLDIFCELGESRIRKQEKGGKRHGSMCDYLLTYDAANDRNRGKGLGDGENLGTADLETETGKEKARRALKISRDQLAALVRLARKKDIESNKLAFFIHGLSTICIIMCKNEVLIYRLRVAKYESLEDLYFAEILGRGRLSRSPQDENFVLSVLEVIGVFAAAKRHLDFSMWLISELEKKRDRAYSQLVSGSGLAAVSTPAKKRWRKLLLVGMSDDEM